MNPCFKFWTRSIGPEASEEEVTQHYGKEENVKEYQEDLPEPDSDYSEVGEASDDSESEEAVEGLSNDSVDTQSESFSDSFSEKVVVSSLISAMKNEKHVSAIYNYIITEAVSSHPGVIDGVLAELDEIIPLCENIEERLRIDLNRLSLPIEEVAKSPFYELKRKSYALKYLLEGHLQE